jgi:hypothetical protein
MQAGIGAEQVFGGTQSLHRFFLRQKKVAFGPKHAPFDHHAMAIFCMQDRIQQ